MAYYRLQKIPDILCLNALEEWVSIGPQPNIFWEKNCRSDCCSVAGSPGLAVPDVMEGELDSLMEAFDKFPSLWFTQNTHWSILFNLASDFLEAAKIHLQGHGMSTQQGGKVPQDYSHMVNVRRQTIRSYLADLRASIPVPPQRGLD